MRRISLPLWLVSVFLYIFLYAPIVVVIVYSFNASRYGGPWRGFTTATGRPAACSSQASTAS